MKKLPTEMQQHQLLWVCFKSLRRNTIQLQSINHDHEKKSVTHCVGQLYSNRAAPPWGLGGAGSNSDTCTLFSQTVTWVWTVCMVERAAWMLTQHSGPTMWQQELTRTQQYESSKFCQFLKILG